MIDGKEGREEIVDFATELMGWEEKSWIMPTSQLFNSQTQQTATLKIHPNNGNEYVWIHVDGQEIFKGTLTELSNVP